MMTTIDKIKFAIESGCKYNPITGDVYSPSVHIFNNVNIYNRMSIFVDKKRYQIRCHQFAFYYVYGYLPKLIDHIDRNKLNNSIDNLRDTNSFQNANNRSFKKVGSFDKNRNKWSASIRINGKKVSLGRFDTEAEAIDAYYLARSNKNIIKQ